MPALYKVSAKFYVGEDVLDLKTADVEQLTQILHDRFTPTFGFLEVYTNAYSNNLEVVLRSDEDDMPQEAFPEEWKETYTNKMFRIGENMAVILTGMYGRDENYDAVCDDDSE